MFHPPKRLFLGIAIGIVFIILILTRAAYPLAVGVGKILTPVQKKFYEASLEVFPSFQEKNLLVAQRDMLLDQLTASVERERQAAMCLEESAALQGLLNYKKVYRYPVIAAQVIGFANAESTRILLDRGQESGIQSGDPVIVGEGIMVGRVIRALSGRSLAALLPDPSTSLAVNFPDFPGIEAILESPASGLRLDLIPSTIPLTPQTLVVTSGIDTRIPRNLIIGRVRDVQVRRSAPWLDATVEPVVSPTSLSFVAVLLHERTE